MVSPGVAGVGVSVRGAREVFEVGVELGLRGPACDRTRNVYDVGLEEAPASAPDPARIQVRLGLVHQEEEHTGTRYAGLGGARFRRLLAAVSMPQRPPASF